MVGIPLAQACGGGSGGGEDAGAPSSTVAPTPSGTLDATAADAKTGDATADATADSTTTDATTDAKTDDAAATEAGPPVDPCASQTPACPGVPAGFTEGSGLRAIDRCAFPIAPATGFGANGALITALERLAPKVTLAQVVADTNRVATRVTSAPGNPPGLAYAFRWNAEDGASTDWIPQGITGSPDADATGLTFGKRLILVSFYEDAGLQKGVRIAITDVTDPDAPRYRFALLVEPTGTVAAPSFKQVDLHAGGIVWIGTKLYVAQTGLGFRVFDLARVLEVAVDQDTLGCTTTTCRAGLYKYVIPQIGTYAHKSTCSPLFSWVSLDRSSTPPALVSGEYCSGSACASALAGRVFRWPIDPTTGLLPDTTSWPSEAHLMSHRQVQGGASSGATTWLSSSAPAGGGGALYRVQAGKSATSSYLDSPEDLMVDGPRGWLWGLSEAAGARAVVAVNRASYPPP